MMHMFKYIYLNTILSRHSKCGVKIVLHKQMTELWSFEVSVKNVKNWQKSMFFLNSFFGTLNFLGHNIKVYLNIFLSKVPKNGAKNYST